MAESAPSSEPTPPLTEHGDTSALLADTEFQELARRKNSLSITLSVALLAIYFGYMLLLAFAPQVLAARLGAVTLGIPLGIGVIVIAWILTGIYVRWANGPYDAMVKRVKGKVTR